MTSNSSSRHDGTGAQPSGCRNAGLAGGYGLISETHSVLMLLQPEAISMPLGVEFPLTLTLSPEERE
jgi:hypothetical protein